MNKKKIINDPVFGFIQIPTELIFDLIEHPYFQRLRRIKQLGMTDHIYPGATHTRFSHALGAMHLMTKSINILQEKGIEIKEEEKEAACIAILLHDIGHGPFSHTLEGLFFEASHEEMTILILEKLNAEFKNKLETAIAIFKGIYKKNFLHQLVSGQLDMDRLDYLTRDSFFSGVTEGFVGYDRIINMLTVINGEIVIEEKGFFSIEKMLISRQFMYWQVYMHKTSFAFENMLILFIKKLKETIKEINTQNFPKALLFFLEQKITKKDLKTEKAIHNFNLLDDSDIWFLLKKIAQEGHGEVQFLAESIVDRKIFSIEFQNFPFLSDYFEEKRQKLCKFAAENSSSLKMEEFLIKGKVSKPTYETGKKEIMILMKNGKVKPMSHISDQFLEQKIITKYYLCYPKNCY